MKWIEKDLLMAINSSCFFHSKRRKLNPRRKLKTAIVDVFICHGTCNIAAVVVGKNSAIQSGASKNVTVWHSTLEVIYRAGELLQGELLQGELK
jgi:hypothetical protein